MAGYPHLETAVKRFQLSRRSTGSTGDQAATVALMQELSIISAMMRHHASSDTTDWKPVTASAAATTRTSGRLVGSTYRKPHGHARLAVHLHAGFLPQVT